MRVLRCHTLLLIGCAEPVLEVVPFCESELDYRYDPITEMQTFPDDFWTVEDTGTSTGLRVYMPRGDPAFSTLPEEYANLLDQLGTLDGFGLTTPIILEFSTAPVEPVVRVYAELDGVWSERPATVNPLDFGRVLSVQPWAPLPPGARAFVAVHADTADTCISPSAALRSVLTDSTVRLADRYAEALGVLGWSPEHVGAMVVFTTQSAEEVDAAVALDIVARDITLDAPMACTSDGVRRECTGTITVGDYRAADGVVPAGEVKVQGTYALPVVAWLPDTGGPFPVVIGGHGLGGSKSQCDFIADLAVPRGVAILAVDAQQHGDHPLREADDDLGQIMALFGFTLTPPSLDALVLRDNFRASAWDKLQLVHAIQAGMDVDGDDVVDLDGTRIVYAGASLGGIMGPELLANNEAILAGVLVVPGGGLMNLVLDSTTFGIIAAAMSPDDWTEDDLERAIPLVQTLIDAGDPLVFAAATTRNRSSARGPDIALLMAFEDLIVPNSSTSALAAAYAVDGVGDELLPVPGVSFVAGPLTGNLVDGATGGLLQWAETQPEEGAEWEPADHSSLHESIQARSILDTFVQSALEGEVPTLVDPIP